MTIIKRDRSSGHNRLDRLTIHVVDKLTTPQNYRLTPPKLQMSLRKLPNLRERISFSFAHSLAEAGGLESAEVLLAGDLDARNLAVRAPKLRWIQSINAGVEKLIPLVPPGAVLTNASGVHAPKGGEYAFTALLMLNHRVPHFVTSQRSRSWNPTWSSPIAGKTVVIVGTGAIGLAAARLARSFGMRVFGVSLSGRKREGVDRMYRPTNFRTVLPRADFVLVTAPLTPQTQNLLGQTELNLLPRHAGIVNLGRAGIIDHQTLIKKLKRGELSGAVLDVVPREPLPKNSAIWLTPNLILSPHCAVDDAEIYIPRCLDVFFANVERYLAGRPLANLVGLARGY